MTDLAGHVAIVTGANHGIGEAIALAFGRAGAAVCCTYLRNPPGSPDEDPSAPPAYAADRRRAADSVAAAVIAAGSSAIALEADLVDPDVPGRIFDAAEAALGPVDILVNNACAWQADTFRGGGDDRIGRVLAPVSAATHDRLFSVGVRAPSLLIAELARRSRHRGSGWGRIISLTSGGPDGFPEEVSYGASKAALDNLTFSAAQELRDHGITANVIHPPATDTGWVSDEVAAYVSASGNRIAQPDEVAEVALWLASDAARHVTGTLVKMA
jgi:3-oxoacyl-[acyl-carrier protein] reductase